MVLRDKRDLVKNSRVLGVAKLDTLASECGYRYKNKRIRKILGKKNESKTKKNINNVIVFELKRTRIKKEKNKTEKDVVFNLP